MEFSLTTVLGKIFAESGFAGLIQSPGNLLMIIIACVLLYMGIGKKYEPLLLVPIAPMPRKIREGYTPYSTPM